jgi:hypothetical protein
MNHDFYSLFSHYWWLLFPLAWGIGAMVRAFLRHKRAQQTLEIVKTYADQGKEVPPEVLLLLQLPPDRKIRSPVDLSRGFMFVGFICVAMAVAFPVLIFGQVKGDPQDFYGLMFVAVLMAGFAVAFFITAYLVAKDRKRLDPP